MAEVRVKQIPCPWPWYWASHPWWQVGLWPTVSTQFIQHLMTTCYVPSTMISVRITRWIEWVSSLMGFKVCWKGKPRCPPNTRPMKLNSALEVRWRLWEHRGGRCKLWCGWDGRDQETFRGGAIFSAASWKTSNHLADRGDRWRSSSRGCDLRLTHQLDPGKRGPSPSSACAMYIQPFIPRWESFQGCSLQRQSGCWDHLDRSHDWTPLRAL